MIQMTIARKPFGTIVFVNDGRFFSVANESEINGKLENLYGPNVFLEGVKVTPREDVPQPGEYDFVGPLPA